MGTGALRKMKESEHGKKVTSQKGRRKGEKQRKQEAGVRGNQGP